MRLVDNRAINLGLELRYRAFTIVNPELHEMDTSSVQLSNVLAALVRSRRAVRNAKAGFARRTRHRRRCNAFSYREELRCVRNNLVTKFIRQLLVGLEAHAHRCRSSVIGVALKLINQIFASVVCLFVRAVPFVDQSNVVVAVDLVCHHAFARQIYTRGVRWRLPVSFFTYPGKRITLDQERRTLNHWTLVADDQTRAFEPYWEASCLRRNHRG